MPRVLGPHNTRSGMARSVQKTVYSVSVGSGLVVVERLVAMNSLTLPKSLGNSDDTVVQCDHCESRDKVKF